MTQPIITVENLSKAYRVGLKEEAPDTLVGALTNSIRYPLRNFSKLRRQTTIQDGDETDDILWALKDVSFEVNEGEVVGIIGRNGAGKSTLLKILSRITEPTSGRAVIRGRVSSLLEVGTGFHPELTGRENIYMNGTILGMTKREIDRKFDEIVDFSGVEKFLDTPCKRYSSGMQVRLAFAVAAHLEPEILIVDEVLAVGDAEFQMKCLGKMRCVAKGGKTVLFVSHNLAAVRSLCTLGVMLIAGCDVHGVLPVSQAIESYSSAPKPSFEESRKARSRNVKSSTHIESHYVYPIDSDIIRTGERLAFCIDIANVTADTTCTVTVYTGMGVGVCTFLSSYKTEADIVRDPNGSRLICEIEECPFLPGEYRYNVAVHAEGRRVDHIDFAATFTVASGMMRDRPTPNASAYAFLAVPHNWIRTVANE